MQIFENLYVDITGTCQIGGEFPDDSRMTWTPDATYRAAAVALARKRRLNHRLVTCRWDSNW